MAIFSNSFVTNLCILQVPFAEIGGQTLVLAVYDFDRFSKHDMIGQIKLNLNSIDLGQTFETTKSLSPPDDDKEYLGTSTIDTTLFHKLDSSIRMMLL